MRILFENGTPRGVSGALTGHSVEEGRAHGWDTLRNGELLDAAEAAGFDVLLTTDRNIRHQQNLAGRQIAVVVRRGGVRERTRPLPRERVCGSANSLALSFLVASPNTQPERAEAPITPLMTWTPKGTP